MATRASLAPIVELVRREPRARAFLAAHAQSSLGNGAAYVALLVIAYERLRSPWAIALVLAADMVPPMALGPLCGALADRWPRRRCAVAADVVRAGAFLGIALVGGFAAMIALALVAGAGTALFRPAILAGLPSLVDKPRLPAATSLFGALDDLGQTVGPLLAAALLVVAPAETLMLVNALTFAVSAVILARLPFGGSAAADADGRPAPGESLMRETREGLRAAATTPVLRALILATSSIILFAGLFNVAELLLATNDLGAGASGYAVLAGVFGVGVVAGSLVGARGGSTGEIGARYLAGLLLVGVCFIAAGLAPGYGEALVAFALGGVGNGLIIVHERILLQQLVPDRLMGRVFGVKDSLASWAFVVGFVSAGVLLPVVGARAVFVLAGAGALVVWVAASLALRPAWSGKPRPMPIAAVATES